MRRKSNEEIMTKYRVISQLTMGDIIFRDCAVYKTELEGIKGYKDTVWDYQGMIRRLQNDVDIAGYVELLEINDSDIHVLRSTEF